MDASDYQDVMNAPVRYGGRAPGVNAWPVYTSRYKANGSSLDTPRRLESAEETGCRLPPVT